VVAILPSSAATATESPTGRVTGVVRLVGPPAVRPPLEVFKHHEVCGDSVSDDRLVIGPGGGVRYATVTIEGVRGGKKPERDLTHVLDNRTCRFRAGDGLQRSAAAGPPGSQAARPGGAHRPHLRGAPHVDERVCRGR
jgi:hypothetical protein